MADRTYSLSTLITVGLFAIGFGIGAGYVIGRGPPPTAQDLGTGDETPGARSARSRAQGPGMAGGITSDGAGFDDPLSPGEGDDAAYMEEMLQEEMERSQDLETRVFELQARLGEVEISEEKRAAAKKVYDDVLGLDDDAEDGDALMEMLGRLGDLGEEEAAYFMEQYLANLGKSGSPKEREAALMLAILSGGPRVADFLSDLLNDPGMPRADRVRLLMSIGSPRQPVYSMDRIPVTSSLAQTAFGMVDSSKPVERRGGAAMLGGLNSSASRYSLEALVQNDRDFRVRIAAIQSLGRVGDQGSKYFLMNFQGTLSARPKSKIYKRLKGPLKGTIKKLEKKYPD